MINKQEHMNRVVMYTSHYSVKELIYGWVMKLDKIREGGKLYKTINGKHLLYKENGWKEENFVGFMLHIVSFWYYILFFIILLLW